MNIFIVIVFCFLFYFLFTKDLENLDFYEKKQIKKPFMYK